MGDARAYSGCHWVTKVLQRHPAMQEEKEGQMAEKVKRSLIELLFTGKATPEEAAKIEHGDALDRRLLGPDFDPNKGKTRLDRWLEGK